MAITRDLINWFNEFVLRQKRYTTITGDYQQTPETQNDKPSAHSSLYISNMLPELHSVFPERKGYRVSLVANTNSMEPLIDDNCILVSESLTGKYKSRLKDVPLSVGDIVIYGSKNYKIVHRLVSQDSNGNWLIKGDNNFRRDPVRLKTSEVLSRVCCIVYTQPKRKND